MLTEKRRAAANTVRMVARSRTFVTIAYLQASVHPPYEGESFMRPEIPRDSAQSARRSILTLRRTRIPGPDANDWSVVLDGSEIVGRIYRAPQAIRGSGA